MKKFARHRTLKELKPLCVTKRIDLNTTKHDRDFSDFVTLTGTLEGVGFTLLFSVFNGTFFGKTDDGVTFSERSELDDNPFYDALLAILFVEKEEAVHV